ERPTPVVRLGRPRRLRTPPRVVRQHRLAWRTRHDLLRRPPPASRTGCRVEDSGPSRLSLLVTSLCTSWCARTPEVPDLRLPVRAMHYRERPLGEQALPAAGLYEARLVGKDDCLHAVA